MTERKGVVTFQGTPLTLAGDAVNVGERAPDAELTGNDMKPVALSSLLGKTLVIASVPSLDTPVCDAETRRFNKEAAGLGPDVRVLVVSMDLPFAQARWCGSADISRVLTLSDYRDRSFGRAYGLLIKELSLLARSVMVVDREGVLRYRQIVEEIASEPDYEAVLAALRDVV